MYETDDDYTAAQIKLWEKFLDSEIGTDYEVNESASGHPDEYYIVIMDLEVQAEVNAVREFESTKRVEWSK